MCQSKQSVPEFKHGTVTLCERKVRKSQARACGTKRKPASRAACTVLCVSELWQEAVQEAQGGEPIRQHQSGGLWLVLSKNSVAAGQTTQEKPKLQDLHAAGGITDGDPGNLERERSGQTSRFHNNFMQRLEQPGHAALPSGDASKPALVFCAYLRFSRCL